jgi:hypothetical protein
VCGSGFAFPPYEFPPILYFLACTLLLGTLATSMGATFLESVKELRGENEFVARAFQG